MRISVEKNLPLLAMALASGVVVWSSCDDLPRESSCFVTTTSGNVQGVGVSGACAFLAIPFAAPPIGALRWKPPQPAPVWAPETLDATKEAAVCPQVAPIGSDKTQGDEDCLHLNVWRPHASHAAGAPVIVWIHDGGFASASANLAAHHVRKISEHTGAVVVAANHRIGPLGFLGHPALTAEDPAYASSGNYGLLDQRAALAWVRQHIAAFGGNPDDITIAGQSSGAQSVGLHLVSPGSAGLFTRAVMHNGFASSRWRTLADAETVGRDFAAALGCTEPIGTLACLRGKSRDDILLALPTGYRQFAETSRAPWEPVVDGLEIPDQPRAIYQAGVFNHAPTVVVATRDIGWEYVDRSFPTVLSPEVYEAEVEAEFGTADAARIRAQYPLAQFPSPKHALARMTADVEIVCEANRIAQLFTRAHTPVLALFPNDGQGLVDSINDVWPRFPTMKYLNEGRHGFLPPETLCEFWNPFFLGSVAGPVPASQQ